MISPFRQGLKSGLELVFSMGFFIHLFAVIWFFFLCFERGDQRINNWAQNGDQMDSGAGVKMGTRLQDAMVPLQRRLGGP